MYIERSHKSIVQKRIERHHFCDSVYEEVVLIRSSDSKTKNLYYYMFMNSSRYLTTSIRWVKVFFQVLLLDVVFSTPENQFKETARKPAVPFKVLKYMRI